MSVLHPANHQPTLTEVFDCLTESRRRQTLEALLSADGSRSEQELATDLADGHGIAARDPETVRAALRHVHLPKLEAMNLVAWDSAAGSVTLGDHPILADEQFRSLLASDDDRWDRATTVHADECRRAIVETLSTEDGATTRDALAERLAADDCGGEDAPTAERLAVQLHHVHLPKLASVGLLSYDASEGTVDPAADLDVPWFEASSVAN